MVFKVKNITNSSTGLRNVCTFPAKTRSKVANITTRGELGVSEDEGIMVRSLRKGTTSMYFQHEHTGHSIGVKQCESEVDGGVAVLKVTVAPVDSNQKHDETYLHDEPLLSAAIDDKTVIEGFIAHVDSGVPKVEEYKLELVSRGKRLVKNVVPELAQQGNLRTLHLNVENR